MNRDLLLFLSRLPHEESLNSTSETRLVNYWKRAAEQWNATHEPVYTTVCDVEAAFRLRWPQIYGGINGSELYLSFSYIDYLFTENEDGTVSGGIFIRGGEKPTVRLNMTPVQIVELAMALRKKPSGEEILKENLARHDQEGEYIEAYSQHEYRNVAHPLSETDALHQKAIHMEEKASALYDMGYYEDALDWFKKSLITKHAAGLENSYSDYAYTVMGDIYYKLLDWDMADTCFQYAYKICCNAISDKTDEDIEDKLYRFRYLANMYSQFLSRTGRNENYNNKLMQLLKNFLIDVKGKSDDSIHRLRRDLAISLGLI